MSRMSKKVQRAVLERAGGRCEAEGCGIDVVALAGMPAAFRNKYLPKGASAYEIDHVRPFSDSGDNSMDNLQLYCGNCHADKSAGERPEYKRGERSYTLDGVQPRPGARGLSASGMHPGLVREVSRRVRAAGM